MVISGKELKYPKHKPSGIEWIGEIPEGWNQVRFRFVNNLNPYKSETASLSNDYKVSFLPMEKLSAKGELDLSEIKPLSAVRNGFTYFRDGDVIVAKITPCFENGKGALCSGLRNGIGFGSTELHVLRSNGRIRPKLLFYITMSDSFRKTGVSEMTGAAGQQRVPESFIRNYRIPLPPLSEQDAIAAFLDRETGRIDKIIEAKRRLIELLAEKRAALISALVCGQVSLINDPATGKLRTATDAEVLRLRPSRPDLIRVDCADKKPSGIDWFGNIPEGWKIKKLKHVGRMRSGESITSEDIEPEGMYPVYGGNGLRGYTKSFTHNGYLPLIGRQGALCGCINYAEGQFWASEHAVVVTPVNCHVKWLGELLRSMDLNRFSQSAAQPGLAVGTITELFVPVPPFNAQLAIVEYLDHDTARIDALTKKHRQVIDTMIEYRSALISAAVTGKIDVRDCNNA